MKILFDVLFLILFMGFSCKPLTLRKLKSNEIGSSQDKQKGKQVRHQHGLRGSRSNMDEIRLQSYTHHGDKRGENDIIKGPRERKSFPSDNHDTAMKADQANLNPNTDSRHLGNGKRDWRNRWGYSDKYEDKVDNKGAMLQVIDMGTHSANKDPSESGKVPHNITGKPNEPPPVTTSHKQLNGFTSIPQRFFKIPKSEKEMKALVEEASSLNICLRATSSMKHNSSKGAAIDYPEKFQTQLLAKLCINDASTSNVRRKEKSFADSLAANSIPEPSPPNPTSKILATIISRNSDADGKTQSQVQTMSIPSSSKSMLSDHNINNSVASALSKKENIKFNDLGDRAKDILLQVCSGETSVLKITRTVILDVLNELRHVKCWQADALTKLYKPLSSSTALTLDTPLPISSDLLDDTCSLSRELERHNCFQSPDVPHTSAWPLDPPPKTDWLIPTTTHSADILDAYPFFKENRARLEWENDILFY